MEGIRCESWEYQKNECLVRLPSGNNQRKVVYLVKQLSRVRCRYEENFGLEGKFIWVDNGCRGVFGVELEGK